MASEILDLEKMLCNMRVLCKDIPPRKPTTEGDRKAAEYILSTLNGMGVKARMHKFKGIATLGLPALLSVVMGLLGFFIGWWAGPIGKWIGGAVVLIAAYTLWGLFLAIQPFFKSLLERRDSQNVIATVPAKGEAKQKIYLLGHIDAQKQRFLIPPPMPATMRPTQTLTVVLTFLAGLSFFAEAIFGWQLFIFQVIAAAFLGIMFVLVSADEFQPTVEGANDNASAVVILLSIAEALKQQPLENTEVHFLFTGCEEVGHQGLKAYLKEFNPSSRDSFWIDLELVGAGNLCYATRHGVTYVNLYHPGKKILQLADETAAAHPELSVSGRDMLILEEVATLRMDDYEAICLMGYDEKGFLPLWHRLSDNMDNIQPDTLHRAAKFTWELMKTIDSK